MRHLAVLLLCLCVSASAQVTQLSLQVLNQSEKKATYRLTNNSDKPLTCYSVAVSVTYNDGQVASTQTSECDYATGILAPQASVERTVNLELNTSNHSGTARMEILPSLAVFQDGTTETKDVKSWHILMDSVKSENDGTRDVIATLQKTGNDPVKAIAALKILQQKATPKSPYDDRLKEAIAFLTKSPKADDVKAYADHLGKAYTMHKPYADLQPAGGVK